MKMEWEKVMRRPLLIAFTALLLSALILTGCYANKSVTVTESSDPKADITSSSVSTDTTSYDDQLTIIADQVSLWMGNTELTAEPYFYAVTDLDQNGRLEIIQASCQGTGIYTYSYLWEVSADGAELVPVQFSISEEESQPDIITNPDKVYFDEEHHCYHYIFRDDIRNGAAEYYQSIVDFSLQDGVINTTALANMHTLYSNAGKDVQITYTDAEGNEIDEATYNAAADQAFTGQKVMNATIGWTDYTASEQLATLDEDDLLNILQSSWEGFSLN